MKQYLQRWQLKNKAKDILAGRYGEAILLTFIYGMFTVADGWLSSALMSLTSKESNPLMRLLFPEATPNGYLLSLAVSLLTSVLLGMLSAGISLFYLNMACKQPVSLKDLFCTFKEQPNKYLLLALTQTLIYFISSLPAHACNYFNLLDPSVKWAVLFYVCQIVGQLAAYPLILGISQCYRLLWDYPELTAPQALLRSWKIMNGHKVRLFLLTLSFLPLEIAATFTLGIGYLWLNPYKHMTYTLFYLDLMQD